MPFGKRETSFAITTIYIVRLKTGNRQNCLASLLVSAGTRDAAESYARSLARAAPAAQKIEVLGPAEAPLAVIRGRFRFRLLVKAAREADLQAYLRLWLKEAPKPKGDVRLTVDIDPYSFL